MNGWAFRGEEPMSVKQTGIGASKMVEHLGVTNQCQLNKQE